MTKTDTNALIAELEKILPLIEQLETGQDCEEYAYAKGALFQAMTYAPEAFEALRCIPEAATELSRLQAEVERLTLDGNAPPVSVLRQMQAAEDQVERVAKAIAKADGLDFDEVCGVEADPEEGYCDSGTCVAALYEDHDPDHARGVYMRQARAALAAMDREPGVYQSAADCPLGDAHGMASTHGRASDGVDCCDFCGFPSQPAPQDGEDQCPFCGSSDNFIERADFSSCYVTCNECGAHGPTSCDETEEDANATENDECEPGERPARRLWQTRHREQSIAELRAENEPLLQLISTVREHLADGEIGAAIVAIDKFTRPERQALSGQGDGK